jgi:hypothetical protein
MQYYPHQQSFHKAKAVAAMAERFNTGAHISPTLKRRQKDFDLMIAKPKIGDGHRDASGYTKPGSNKK